MGDNSVNESINIPIEEDEDTRKQVNSFSDALDSIGKITLDRYEDKTSNITSENIIGHIRCEVLNDWKLRNYGFKHESLDLIRIRMPQKSMSRSGFGLTKLIEAIKGIQASFEQNDGLRNLRDNMLQRRV